MNSHSIIVCRDAPQVEMRQVPLNADGLLFDPESLMGNAPWSRRRLVMINGRVMSREEMAAHEQRKRESLLSRSAFAFPPNSSAGDLLSVEVTATAL